MNNYEICHSHYSPNRYDYDDIAGLTITPTFRDVYTSEEVFLEEYNNGMFPTTISATSARTLYYLLYARYGNEEMADTIDIHQWKAQLMSIIFQYAPAWEKRLEIQEKIRGWNEDQILQGSEEIYNMAQHPGKAVPEDGLVKAINQQNVNYRKKDKMNAYSYLLSLLDTDITEELLIRFKPLFNPFSGIKSKIHYFTEEVDG